MNPLGVIAFCVSVFALFTMLAVVATQGKKPDMPPITLERSKWVCTSVDVRKLDNNGMETTCLEYRKVKK